MNEPFYLLMRAVGPEPSDEWLDYFADSAESRLFSMGYQVVEHLKPEHVEARVCFHEEIGMEAKTPEHWLFVTKAC